MQPALQTTTANIAYSTTAVTLSQAEELALHFLQSKSPNATVAIKGAQTIVKNGMPYFHVINGNKGFVIVAPDSLYVPILAYDKTGNFSFAQKDLNPGLEMWMNKHAHELDFVRNNKSAYIDSIGRVNKLLWCAMPVATLSATAPVLTPAKQGGGRLITNGTPPVLISSVPASMETETTVGPLCPTIWGQQNPWNNQIPSGDAVGCVPVAMGQVMYFWGLQYPTSIAIKYNWASMPLDTYQGGMLSANSDCFRLLHDIGTTQTPSGGFVSYGPLNSSAQVDNIPFVFGAFNFNGVAEVGDFSTTQYLSGPQDNTFGSLITSEVQNNNRPCIISGYPSESSVNPFGFTAGGTGHTWVCDGTDIITVYTGYTDTYQSSNGTITTQTGYTSNTVIPMLHMNWGMDGTNDLWYNANVNYTTYNSYNNYDYFQAVDYNIHL